MRWLGAVLVAMFGLAACCTEQAPQRYPPPPPPVQQGPIVQQPPPPPPAYPPQPPPPAYPPTYHPPPPPPGTGGYHPATPIPTTQQPMGVNAQQAEQIAVQYAQGRGFNVHKVKRVDLDGRNWVVELQGHPPTPGQLRIWVDSGSGAVVGDDSRPGEGHEHGPHEHGAAPPMHH